MIKITRVKKLLPFICANCEKQYDSECFVLSIFSNELIDKAQVDITLCKDCLKQLGEVFAQCGSD